MIIMIIQHNLTALYTNRQLGINRETQSKTTKMVEFSRSSILEQFSQSILAQANSNPEVILNLLRM